jgi:thymidylate synthase (FAD)
MENQYKTPKVTLVSGTALPLETIYSVWDQSKEYGAFRGPEQIKAEVSREEIRALFSRVISQRIPVGEHIDFIFELENISISWREQAVRHRIGTKASPERLGADMVMDVQSIPDLADSSWWSQSMRLMDMSRFAEDKNYRMPQSILKHPDRGYLESRFKKVMLEIQDGYEELVRAGIPAEDARELVPLGAQHRMTWKLNIGSLQHIVGKRGCWILQLGIWGPVIKGMISELVTKVDPIFGEIVTPPCLSGDTYTGCKYEEENARRYDGSDPLPPCSLHFYKRATAGGAEVMGVDASTARARAESENVPVINEMMERAEEYRAFWGRDPFTGRRLRVVQG